MTETEHQASGDQLFEHHRFVADAGQNPLRIDKFLNDHMSKTSRTRIQQAALAGYIKVNDRAVKTSYKVRPGDVITVFLPYPVQEIELVPEDIPLDIVYEDEAILIVNKAAGMVVHPGVGNFHGTLVNALLHHFGTMPEQEHPHPGSGSDTLYTPRPGLVHRIDKDTSGLLVIARTEQALSNLALQFFNHSTERSYLALVWGSPEKEGTIEGHIGRSLKNRKVMSVFPDGSFGKAAVTHWEKLEDLFYVSLLRCRLETGRTHQIRAHFQHLGHPLFNDAAYGGDRILKGTTFTKYKQFVNNCFSCVPGQALHAATLGFVHPVTGKKMTFDAPLPEGFSQLCEKWRNYAKINS